MIENSLDAGATSVDIFFRNFGSEGLEVKDNGRGIDVLNLEAITMKGATSKLADFEGLQEVKTYGFRGEALNAICALSELQITTRFKDSQLGYRLVFGKDNQIVEKVPVSCEVGTIISIKNLFHSIPVRKIDFEKNYKLQYLNSITLINEFSIIST